MKKLLIFLFALVFSLSIIGTANATLTGFYEGADHFVYDSIQNITWYDYSNPANTWQNQLNWANSLHVGNTIAGSWSLPTTPAINTGYTDEGQMGYLYYHELGNSSGNLTNVGPFTDLGGNNGGLYWTNTLAYSWEYYYNFNVGSQGITHNSGTIRALAVHEGNIQTSTPEPATMLLLGLGLMGLAGVRRKFKK